MRVLIAAVALSALSFVAGVAGDLSRPANSGAAVTLRIPPPIPADAPRAAPLPPLRTAAASAATVTPGGNEARALLAEAEAAPAKQRRDRVLRLSDAKLDARRAAKAPPKKGA